MKGHLKFNALSLVDRYCVIKHRKLNKESKIAAVILDFFLDVDFEKGAILNAAHG